jgi:hypothetical protein
MTLTVTDRLPTLDREQLLNLRTNARRLQADTGKKAGEASALLPLIDAEIARRGPAAAAKRSSAPKG